MDALRSSRLAAAAGIIGVGVALVGQLLVLDAPAIDKPAAEIRAWAVDNRGLALTASYLLVLGFTVQLGFWVGVWRRLRRREGGDGLLATTGFAGVLLLTALLVAAFAFSTEVAFRGSGLSDDTARVLNDLVFISANLSDIATALALGALSWVTVRYGGFPRWLGWAGLALAALHLFAGAAFAHEGFFSPQGIGIYLAPILFYIWVVAASVVLWRNPEVAAS